MSEIVSRQAAKLAANIKQSPHEANGKKRCIVITTPAAHAAGLNDTIGSGIPLPIGTRFTTGTRISNGAGAASSTLSIGIRDYKTKVAIDAAGIASAVALTAAASGTVANNGTFVAAGTEYITTQVAELYATFTGAAPTANQQVRIEAEVITTD